ncbi:helix-turn-helix domain-containing protein, partial [Chryseobacterium taklimakanense]|uniref:helix-turn-helix domain-containing protein n=1 Tax=Chryseobacterium taklimakanense TaxID=536441 RepID=UPI0023F7F0F8
NNVIGKNIRKLREIKGYSQEYMAHELNINQASYAKLENSSTKITVDRLFAISKLLETDVADILELNKQTIFNQNNNTTANAFANVGNLHQENREVYEKLIQAKDEQIALLKEMLAKQK